VVLISMNEHTHSMAIHTVNTEPELANELIALSMHHIRDAQQQLEARKHLN